jgi:predicted phosphate transport protein (TIGR00153 family)
LLFGNAKDQQFYAILRKAAENAVETAAQLSKLLENPTQYPDLVPLIKELESKGDEYTHQLFSLINKTFVTPLEREDLASLGVAIDSVVDSMEAAAARISIYKVKETDRHLKAFAQILRAQATELVAAIDLLAGSKLLQIRERAFQINVLENHGDDQLRMALSELYDNAQANPVRFITMKEIYETLEDATDQVEAVANTLEGVVMKHA